MLSVNELVTHESSHLEPFLPTVPRPPPPVKPDLPTVQRLAPPSHVASGLFTTEDAEASLRSRSCGGRGPTPWLGQRVDHLSTVPD
ncbi:hypothetical protein EDB85DRAFT_2150367 [Lactarius pseudohatsudake]|nr:hypothetical protein EDB85DRAFT_2150367 [Lactarius pseudohatsudake]